jgi:hypothetical protein
MLSVRIANVPTEIQTEHLLNMSPDHYCYPSLFTEGELCALQAALAQSECLSIAILW